jgi:hypothetical protein
MGERHTLKLAGANRAKAYKGVEAAIAKGKQPDAKPWTLELRERTRTDEQNDALHGLIDQILKQRPVHNGVRMDKVPLQGRVHAGARPRDDHAATLDGDRFFPLGLSTSSSPSASSRADRVHPRLVRRAGHRDQAFRRQAPFTPQGRSAGKACLRWGAVPAHPLPSPRDLARPRTTGDVMKQEDQGLTPSRVSDDGRVKSSGEGSELDRDAAGLRSWLFSPVSITWTWPPGSR